MHASIRPSIHASIHGKDKREGRTGRLGGVGVGGQGGTEEEEAEEEEEMEPDVSTLRPGKWPRRL